jgi:hypothetical protein
MDEDEKPEEKPVRRTRAAKPKDEDGICSKCWPHGWPSADVTSAGCEHGNYKR